MTNNVVIDMHQYSELLGYKKMVDTKYQQLKLEFDDKLAVKNRLCDKLQDSFDDVCKQRDNLQESVYKLNGKITELENQIRKLKNKKHWLWS